MIQWKRTLLALVPVLLLSACAEEPRKHHAEFYIFGTLMGITLWGADEHQAEQAFGVLQDRFQAMHRDWHAWEPGLLMQVNDALAAGQTVAADSDIIEMIRRSQELEPLTGGRFNPTIGALVRAWGFHTSVYPILGPPPEAETIDRLVAQRPSSLDISIDGLELSSSNPAVQLDFGGIAKGFAIDIACQLIRELGIENAIVNAGGDLRAFGNHGERPWRIAVRAPGGGVVGSLEAVGDEAIFTSGNYERFRQGATERYPHILDPRNGWPVQDLSSVTVVTSDGMTADAAATALIVAGLDEWQEVAHSLQLDQVLMIDASGKVFMTPDMAGRMTFAEGTVTEVVELEGR